jgi:hypothetical protein
VSELRLVPPPQRAERRRALRSALARLGRPLRVLAEDVSGLDGCIDLVAADPAGRVVLVLVADEGGDLELLAHGLAQRAWLAPRLRDWLQLAPDLGIRPGERIELFLVAPEIGARTRAAARAVDAERIALARCRWVGDPAGGPARPLLDPVPLPGEAPAGVARSSAFRTGLSDELLGLGNGTAH